jgi:hypothetical protein
MRPEITHYLVKITAEVAEILDIIIEQSGQGASCPTEVDEVGCGTVRRNLSEVQGATLSRLKSKFDFSPLHARSTSLIYTLRSRTD